jgi:hypothetical protein
LLGYVVTAKASSGRHTYDAVHLYVALHHHVQNTCGEQASHAAAFKNKSSLHWKNFRVFRDFKDFKDFKENFPSKPLGALQSKVTKGACLTLFIVGQAIFFVAGCLWSKI